MNSHYEQPYDQLYDWQADLHPHPSPPFAAPLSALPEHGFAMARPGSFAEFSPLDQRAFLSTEYRGASPASASPSGGSSPWSTASFPSQDVMFHPELSKFNRGSRGSMNSLALPSMRSSNPNMHAYTSGSGRPHAMSLSHVEAKEEHPWNLVSWQPFNQDGTAPGTAAFFLRSPTPTKRQRTNQACEKCRERKAKCNGARPTCQRCQARGHICEYAKERRMRGPNRTGRRGSQADLEDPVEGALVSETTVRSGADSPTSTSSPRSSSELAQDPPQGEQSKPAQSGIHQQANRARSDSGSPTSQSAGLPSPPPASRDRSASGRAGVTIALPTLTNGNLSLHPASARLDQRAASSESALRYAQSMPHIGFRYGQDAFLREEQPTGVWSTTLDAPSMSDISRVDEPHSSPSEFPLSDIQTMQYSVSDVSSSSTPITPDRFEYTWPPDEAAAQQSTFQFVETKPAQMLPTLPEFDAETDTLGHWAETHADDQPVIMAENLVPISVLYEPNPSKFVITARQDVTADESPDSDVHSKSSLRVLVAGHRPHKLLHPRSSSRSRDKLDKSPPETPKEQNTAPAQSSAPAPAREMPPTLGIPGSKTRPDPGSRSQSGTPLHLKDFVHDFIVKRRDEKNSEAHQIFRSYPGHAPKGMPQTVNPDEETVPGIQHPGSTGVIYCTDRAMANGFVGDIPDAPARPQTVTLPHDSLEYAPTTGVKELRKAVADLYNHTYRQGKKSQYTHENVCIVPGGRAGLSRVAAVVGDVYCGYQVPEYTTYSEVLSVFKRLVPIPTALTPESRYKIDIKQAKHDIGSQGLQIIVASNPRNPTGQVIKGDELKELVDLSKHHCSVVLDEDAVVLIDGLTKNWRLPGWRVCWVIGPKNLISALSQSGSFLDGGANHPLQLAAIPLLDPEHVAKEKASFTSTDIALQNHFRKKRDHVLDRLEKMGLPVAIPPQATFYIWLDLRMLPAPLNDGLTFFEELLKEKTIVVPGIFFEINPSHRRDLFSSPCHHFVRISFGPPLEDLDKGLNAIERVLRRAKKEGMNAIGVDLIKSPVEGHFPGVH
ncbi:hypothetical protein FRC07_005890 [Ceratobasidium sp. 392]|nr:hypothetical protein FRC07_005890 [Ceratobasidium sp. 392]